MPLTLSRIGVGVFLAILIAGAGLRIWHLGIPDMATDEAQFALGVSPAQPPAGLLLMQAFQWIFGPTQTAARMLSVLCGFIGVGLLGVIAWRISSHYTAMIVAMIAATFPSHVIFSRLAYLSAPLTAAWLLIILMFIVTEQRQTPWSLIGLYLACVLATFIKTQALIVPVLLIMYRVICLRKKALRDPVAWMLLVSLLPIGMYIATHPGILATVAQYGGNQYGINGLFSRLRDFFLTIGGVMGIALIVLIAAAPALKRMPAAWWIMLAAGLGQGVVLGPHNAYYVTDLVLLALPMGIAVTQLPKTFHVLAVIVICCISGFSSWRHIRISERNNYWTTHADAINEALSEAPEVIVVGDAGHHLRWYVDTKVLVGNDMNLTDRPGYFLLLDPNEEFDGEKVYDDGTIRIVTR